MNYITENIKKLFRPLKFTNIDIKDGQSLCFLIEKHFDVNKYNDNAIQFAEKIPPDS